MGKTVIASGNPMVSFTKGQSESSRLVDYHVYVLVSERTGRRYVGSAHDLADRLARHNRGRSKATRHGVPWRLAHVESFPSRAEAVRRELFFKTGKGRDELNRIVSGHPLKDGPQSG